MSIMLVNHRMLSKSTELLALEAGFPPPTHFSSQYVYIKSSLRPPYLERIWGREERTTKQLES